MGSTTSFPQDIFPQDIVTVIVEFWAENFAEYLLFGQLCKTFYAILQKMHLSRSSFVNYFRLTESSGAKRQGILQRPEEADIVVFLNGVYSLKDLRFQTWKDLEKLGVKPSRLREHFVLLSGGVYYGFPTQFNSTFLSQILREHDLQIAAKGLRYRQLWDCLKESLNPRRDLPYTIVLRGKIPDEVYYILIWYYKSFCTVRPIDMHFSYRGWSEVEALFLKLEDFVEDERDESENLFRLFTGETYACYPKFEPGPQYVPFRGVMVIFMEPLLREGLRQRRMAMLKKLREKLGNNVMKEIVWDEDANNYDHENSHIFDEKKKVTTRMKRDAWFTENRGDSLDTRT